MAARTARVPFFKLFRGTELGAWYECWELFYETIPILILSFDTDFVLTIWELLISCNIHIVGKLPRYIVVSTVFPTYQGLVEIVYCIE